MTGPGNIGPFGSVSDVDADHGKRKGIPPPAIFATPRSIIVIPDNPQKKPVPSRK